MKLSQPLHAGDIVLFDDSSAVDLVHIVERFLPNAIDCVTRSRFSHSAMVFDLEAPIHGEPQREVHIIESTILRGRNGVQLNPLAQRLDDYHDGRAIVLHLTERMRTFLDFGAMWALAAKKLDHDEYAVEQLLAWLARYLPIVNDVPQLYEGDGTSEQCAQLVATLLAAGGVPGLRPATFCPQKLAELRMYADASWLIGEPILIRNFNSV